MICTKFTLYLVTVRDLECQIGYIGDGICTESCNNSEFEFDAGDCCLPVIVGGFCIDCLCHQTLTKNEKYACSLRQIGDYRCQDECNQYYFLFDFYDCCLEAIDSFLCSDCICHLDGTRHSLFSQGGCFGFEVRDGKCDDNCNLDTLYYDGGDCCLDYISDDHCQDCICHEDGTKHPNRACHAFQIGDHFCDDECNKESFDYDGGDCCTTSIVDTFCINCLCLEEGNRRPSVFCSNSLMIGDGICDDGCNTVENQYDLNDCCLPLLTDMNCKVCQCLNQVDEGIPFESSKHYCLRQKIGDGKCHDECNNEQYQFDHMDCCHEQIIDSMCQSCICHQDDQRHPAIGLCTNFLVGNGICNDECNTFLNAFDGGDCCIIDPVREQCSICDCVEASKDAFTGIHESGGCNPGFTGNARCEESCNQLQYQFDKGDCCLPQINDEHCIDCICHQDKQRHDSSLCTLNMIGDGFCDKSCNHEGQKFDGFDCCLDYINAKHSCSCIKTDSPLDTCKHCKCHLDLSFHKLDCPVNMIQDGKCHEECNIEYFDYDGLDCCLEAINDIKCQDCICHLDSVKHPTSMIQFQSQKRPK